MLLSFLIRAIYCSWAHAVSGTRYTRYHYVPHYKNLLYISIKYKRSIYFGTEWYITSTAALQVLALVLDWTMLLGCIVSDNVVPGIESHEQASKRATKRATKPASKLASERERERGNMSTHIAIMCMENIHKAWRSTQLQESTVVPASGKMSGKMSSNTEYVR